MWRHWPWLLGVLLAPLLFGSVGSEGQATVGVCFGLSLLLLASDPPDPRLTGAKRRWMLLGTGLLLLPLVPLPAAWVGAFQPERLALARAFPVDAGPTGAWVPLTCSWAGSLQRTYVLGLVAAAFWLARAAGRHPGFPRQLVLVLALAIGALAAVEMGCRLDPERRVLGVWKVPWGIGGGTFANRNHFAGWVLVASLFCLGGILRGFSPLHQARGHKHTAPRVSPTLGWLLTLPVAAGAAMATSSGSRAAFLAFLAGLGVWVVLLSRRAHSARRLIKLGGILLVALLLLVAGGDLLLSRLADTGLDLQQRYPKLDLWEQTLHVWTLFPLCGTGWGSFVRVFDHYKNFGGDLTFYHAENDYLQLLTEGGLLGALFFGGVFLGAARRPVGLAWSRSVRLAEPELTFSAAAALVAFALHAFVDFVFQIPANAILAAVLAGFLSGQAAETEAPLVPAPPSRLRFVLVAALGILLVVAGAIQGLAAYDLYRGNQIGRGRSWAEVLSSLKRSARLWPWNTKAQLALTRASVQSAAGAPRDLQRQMARLQRLRLTSAIGLDPLNWELRWERLWLDLAYGDNRAATLREADLIQRLNPRQPEIPLRLAEHFVSREEGVAFRYLQSVPIGSPHIHRRTLELCWRLRGDAASLWSLTPQTKAGLLTLAEFAMEKKLFGMAATAYSLLERDLDAEELATRFLAAKRPDLAERALRDTPASPRLTLLRARAAHAQGRHSEALRWLETLWTRPEYASRLAELRTRTATDEPANRPPDRQSLLERAEAVYRQSADRRDLTQLRHLLRSAPDDPRLLWISYESELAQHQYAEATQSAIALTATLVSPP